jgi:hypothetical protein
MHASPRAPGAGASLRRTPSRLAGPLAFLSIATLLAACTDEEPLALQGGTSRVGWSQWGQDARHQGRVAAAGQPLKAMLADVPLDRFLEQEVAEVSGGDERDLLVHYQAPLVAGDDVHLETKAGTYTPCAPPGSGKPAPCGVDAWGTQVWQEEKWTWQSGKLGHRWTFASDWKPPPNGWPTGGWEPVFHAALAGGYLVVPGAGGAVWVLDRLDGTVAKKIDPFEGKAPDRTFVVGPLTVAKSGDVYYHAVRLATLPPVPFGPTGPSTPWDLDIEDAWLVHVTPDGAAQKASFTVLATGAPAHDAGCPGSFHNADLPWPPSPDAKPNRIPCGKQRPGVNIAPAVADDGTVYTASRAHFAGRASYLLAVTPDLKPKWAASLAGRLDDGCGTETLPANGQPGGCREGAPKGVDPATNDAPAVIVLDSSTASPVVAPDGSVFYGAYTRYNFARGHLFHFSAAGDYLGAYPFGWDITPAMYEHDATYSVLLKENHYALGSYCNVAEDCPAAPEGPYYLTQLAPDMHVESQFQLTNQESCKRHDDGSVTCVSDHPNGFEWCINAPAVDAAGTVYANGEDGVLYAIPRGGGAVTSFFLGESIGAAYTPLTIDPQGRVYAQNVGRLFVIGE